MKFIFSFLMLVLVAAPSFAAELNHSCFVAKSIQVFNTETGANTFTRGATARFDVTQADHENSYEVPILARDGANMGIAKVDTGTLLETPEGDLIQAHAYVEVSGTPEYFGLVSSTESPMARSYRFFTSEFGKEMTMINIDLQCEIKK